MKKLICVHLVLAATLVPFGLAAQEQAQCFGTANEGAIIGAVQMDLHGPNFDAYEWKRGQQERMFFHPASRAIVLDAFANMYQAMPQMAKLRMGEIGAQGGGLFKPHVSHTNGTSIDIFLPIKDSATGQPVEYPSVLSSGYGYKIHFDALYAKGNDFAPGYMVDFEALGELVYQLSQSAKKRDTNLFRVVLIKEFQWALYKTAHGGYLQRNVRWLDDPNDRHDNHIHVDFDLDCKSMNSRPRGAG